MNMLCVLIDVTNCPQSVIDPHFADSGADYSLYHNDAYQIFICRGSLPIADAIQKTDDFFAVHVDRLTGLNYDESCPGGEYPDLMLEFTFSRLPDADLSLPLRLLANLNHTGIALRFDVNCI